MNTTTPTSSSLKMIIQVKQVSKTCHPEDECIAGDYEVSLDFGRNENDLKDMPHSKLASLALDNFHAQFGIASLDDFQISVLDSSGREIEEDGDHEPSSSKSYFFIEKI